MYEAYFRGRSFLSEKDFTATELHYLIDFAGHLKTLKQRNIAHPYLDGKNIALLFEKPSTRTRSAFCVAANDLGAYAEYLAITDLQLGQKESIEDTAKVLGTMYDGIAFRGYQQETIEQLAQYSGVPVWNGLTDQWHPTQMLADFLTIKEHFGHLDKHITVVYIGDGRNNVAHSLLMTGAILGVNITICAPEVLFPLPEIVDLAQSRAIQSGSQLKFSSNPSLSVREADVLYTDTWVSMGEESKIAERIALLHPYQLNDTLLQSVKTSHCIILHCLPALHDLNTQFIQTLYQQFSLTALEISDPVFRSQQARLFQQAENRLHTIKALMTATLGDLFLPAHFINQ